MNTITFHAEIILFYSPILFTEYFQHLLPSHPVAIILWGLEHILNMYSATLFPGSELDLLNLSVFLPCDVLCPGASSLLHFPTFETNSSQVITLTNEA